MHAMQYASVGWINGREGVKINFQSRKGAKNI